MKPAILKGLIYVKVQLQWNGERIAMSKSRVIQKVKSLVGQVIKAVYFDHFSKVMLESHDNN